MSHRHCAVRRPGQPRTTPPTGWGPCGSRPRWQGKPRGWSRGGGRGGGDESDAKDVAPTAVWHRPARPGRGSRIRCVRWNRFRAQQTPDTRHHLSPGQGLGVGGNINRPLSNPHSPDCLHLHHLSFRQDACRPPIAVRTPPLFSHCAGSSAAVAPSSVVPSPCRGG